MDGLTLTEPLADEGTNAPGAIARLVDPLVTQLSVLLVPELTLAGFAVKELITGMEPFEEGELDEDPETPQAASPTQARMVADTQASNPAEMGRRCLTLLLRSEFAESIRRPFNSSKTLALPLVETKR